MEPKRKLVLEILHGPNAPFRADFDSPRSLTVGRHSRCDIVLTQDASMSRTHFRIDFDGHQATLEDLKSTAGCRLDGVPVSSVIPLPDQSVLTAGTTRFRISFEPLPHDLPDSASEASPTSADSIPLMTSGKPVEEGAGDQLGLGQTMVIKPNASILSVEAFLKSTGERIYAVMDAARDATVLGLLQSEADRNCVSLLPSLTAKRWKAYGPFLVDVTDNPELLRQSLEFGWGNAWGIYCISPMPFHEMASHLRSLIMAEGPEGNKMIFRFYDPRVLSDPCLLGDPAIRQAIFARDFRIVMEAGQETHDLARVIGRNEDHIVQCIPEDGPIADSARAKSSGAIA